jgi:hypothetical protein
MTTNLYNIKHMCEETLRIKDEFFLDGDPTVVVSLDHAEGDERTLFGATGTVVESLPVDGVDAVSFKAKELLRAVNRVLNPPKKES